MLDELELARIIAQAVFIWELGESGVMACSPDLVKNMFDNAWKDGAAKKKYLHVAQSVILFLNKG